MEKAKTPKCDQRAVNKYIKNNYDRISLTLYKGQKDVIQAHANAHGYKGINAVISRAIRAQIIQDGGDVAAWDALAPDRAED